MEDVGVCVCRWMVEERAEIRVGRYTMRLDQNGRAQEQRLFGRVTANGGEGRQLL
jgi:hypothetical protein